MKLIPFIFASLACVTARAAVIQPASLSYADVNTAVTAAVSGDVVLMPAGSNNWGASELTIPAGKRIYLIGMGITNTTIHANGRVARVSAHTSGTNVYGFSHFRTFSDSSPFGQIAVGSNANYPPTSSNYNFRVHHMMCDGLVNRGIYIVGRSQGVIDHCVTKNYVNIVAQGMTHQGVTRDGTVTVPNLADDSYTNALQFGTLTDFVCIENNVWDWLGDGDGALDGYADYSLLVRFNLITNSNYMANHEYAFNRSGGRWEFYGNKAYGTGPGIGFDALSHLRSSPGLACSNELVTTGYTMALPQPRLTYYRASGTNVFAAYPTGYYSAGSVTGTNRLDGNINTNTNQYGYPAFDQPGWGDPTVATPTNLTQTFYGCYFKDNLYNGTNTPAIVQEFAVDGNQSLTGADGTPLAEPKDLIVLGRDYFDQTLMPGWTPAQYPHPLAINCGITPASGSVTPTQTIDFDGTSGTGTYVLFLFVSNVSGGTIDPNTGLYTAGATPGVDIVRVIDSGGNIADASVSVTGSAPAGTSAPARLRRILQ